MAVVGAVALLARAGLAVMFAVAGAAKLANLEASRRSMRDFGVPALLAGPVGIAVPVLEIAVGLALLPTPIAEIGAAGALALLLGFTLAIGVNLLRGRKPDCNCFGQLHSKPISAWTFVRNLALSAVAAALVWRGGASSDPCALGCLTPDVGLWASGIAGAVAVIGLIAGQWWMFLTLSRRYGQVLIRVQSLEARLDGRPVSPALANQAVGRPAPPFRLPDPGGRMVSLGDLLLSGDPVFLLFSDPNCSACGRLISDIAPANGLAHRSMTVTIVSRGKDGDSGKLPFLLDRTGATFEAYGVPGTPSAAVVRADGVLETLASGAAAVKDLWLRTGGTVSPTPNPIVGSPTSG
jgi:uncharacterized membrane protein YphA (DoxX/SURF4 family)/peroxiredoxin